MIIFQDKIFHDPIHIGHFNYVHRKEVNKGGLHESKYYLDWIATLGTIRNHHLKVIFFFPFFFFIYYAFIHILRIMHEIGVGEGSKIT